MKNLYSKSRLKKLALIRARKKAKKRKIKRVKARLLSSTEPKAPSQATEEELTKIRLGIEMAKLRAKQARLEHEYSKAQNERSGIHGVHDSARSKGTNHTSNTSR